MMNKEFTYNIAKEADNKAFKDVCSLLMSKLENAEADKLFVDVDGTQIQVYKTPSGEIIVFNDYEVDAVYVDSDVNLNKILQ